MDFKHHKLQGMELNSRGRAEVDLHLIADENLLLIVNKLLVTMGGRRRVISVLHKQIARTSKLFFHTKNGFVLIIFIEDDRVKTILQQIDRMKAYTYFDNGQVGANMTEVYNYLLDEGMDNRFYLSEFA